MGTDSSAASAWGWVTSVLIGTCGRLEDIPEEEVSGEQWQVYRESLDATGASILGALLALQKQDDEELEAELLRVLNELQRLASAMFAKNRELSAGNLVIRYLRLVGAWALATDRKGEATAIAAVVRQAIPEDPMLHSDYWGGKYPTSLGARGWSLPPLSIGLQMAVPYYFQSGEALISDEWRHSLEELIEAQE